MSEQRETHEMYGVSLVILSSLFLLFSLRFIVFNNLYSFEGILNDLIIKIYIQTDNLTLTLRVIYVLSAVSVFYLKKKVVTNRLKKSSKSRRIITGSFYIIVFLLGFSNYLFFNLYIYPFFLFLSIYGAFLIMSVMDIHFQDENIFGVSNQKTRMKLSYIFNTNKNKLKISSAEQHIYVVGGSGSGKSDSILKQTLYQHAYKGHAALIYDFKGNPMTLGKTAYSAFVNAKLDGNELNSKLQFFNFSDVSRSFRINFLDKRYIKSNVDAQQVVSVLLKNINEDWRKKEDVWFRGAKALWVSIIMRLLNDENGLDELISFPLVAELLITDDTQALLEFICADPEAKKILSPVLSAASGSIKQFTGYITSANDAVSSYINDKNLYWLLSENEIDLNINNKEDPVFLILASNGNPLSGYNPLLAVIITLCMEYFGEQNKEPTLFQLDEIYTLFLETLPALANTFRSNGVCMQIGNQLHSMMVDKYGREKAKTLIGACGNQFYGMSNDSETSKLLVEMLSEINIYNESLNTSDTSQSIGESMKKDKVMQIRDVQGMATGNFIGKIANGKPPYFNLQFEKFNEKEYDVPQFVHDEYTEEELNEAVEENFHKICNLANDIIDYYRKEEE